MPTEKTSSSTGSSSKQASPVIVGISIVGILVVGGIVAAVYRLKRSGSNRSASVTHSNVAYNGLGDAAKSSVSFDNDDSDDDDLLAGEVEDLDGSTA
jgi:hypothetical protein